MVRSCVWLAHGDEHGDESALIHGLARNRAPMTHPIALHPEALDRLKLSPTCTVEAELASKRNLHTLL
jgi:hypothetical protein